MKKIKFDLWLMDGTGFAIKEAAKQSKKSISSWIRGVIEKALRDMHIPFPPYQDGRASSSPINGTQPKLTPQHRTTEKKEKRQVPAKSRFEA